MYIYCISCKPYIVYDIQNISVNNMQYIIYNMQYMICSTEPYVYIIQYHTISIEEKCDYDLMRY